MPSKLTRVVFRESELCLVGKWKCHLLPPGTLSSNQVVQFQSWGYIMQITFNMFNFVQLCCHCVKSHLANFDRTLLPGDCLLNYRRSGLYLSWVGSWYPRRLRIEGRRCGNLCTGRQTGAACGLATYLREKKVLLQKLPFSCDLVRFSGCCW